MYFCPHMCCHLQTDNISSASWDYRSLNIHFKKFCRNEFIQNLLYCLASHWNHYFNIHPHCSIYQFYFIILMLQWVAFCCLTNPFLVGVRALPSFWLLQIMIFIYSIFHFWIFSVTMYSISLPTIICVIPRIILIVFFFLFLMGKLFCFWGAW